MVMSRTKMITTMMGLCSLATAITGFVGPAIPASCCHSGVVIPFSKASHGTVQEDDFSFEGIAGDENDVDSGSSARSSLGIDFGRQLLPDTDEDFDILKKACADMIHEKVQNGLEELQKLREKWMRDMERQQEPLEQAMILNGIRESEKFHHRVDLLVGGFMNQTALSRTQTHQLAYEDQRRLEAEDREKERLKKRKTDPPCFEGWKSTNNEWDEWEEDW
jgi:hypothetical protein